MISLHLIIIYAIEGIYFSYICIVAILYHAVLLYISSLLCLVSCW